jgi:enoyl-CoA hydratase/carnithine racemase
MPSNCYFWKGPTRRVIKKPMVAAVSGYAVAGGMELALMCDLRVMEETAVMGVFCRRFGKILLHYLPYLPEYNLLVLGKC